MISIVMPSYAGTVNHIAPTVRQILSCLAQFELVVVMQKPDQAAYELLQQLSLQDSRLVVTKDVGVGISRARNIAIKKSRYDWVLLLDDDIFIEEETLIRLIAYLPLAENRFYYGNIHELGTDEDYLNFPVKQVDLNFFNYNRVCSVALIIHKQLFRQYGMFDETLGSGCFLGAGEESDLIIRALLNGERIAYVDFYTVFHEAVNHDKNKVISYARGTGALYRKFLRCKRPLLYMKFFADLVIRVLLLLTFKSKRLVFFKGFMQGFLEFRRYKNIYL